jgi:integrase
MQQRIAKRKLRYEKGKNYRIRELPSGALQIEIRSTKYGDGTILMPVGTSFTVAHKKAMSRLIELSNADVPELAKKILKSYTLAELIDAYTKFNTDMSERDRINVSAFKKYNAYLHDKTLDQHYLIKKGIEDFIDNRLKNGIATDTVIRQLSPIRAMYRDAGKKRLYGLIDYSVAITNPFDEIDLPNDLSSGRKDLDIPYLKHFQELKIFKAIDEQCDSAIQCLKWNTLVNMALITCLRRGPMMHLKWRDVEWDNQYIKVNKTYWGRGKVAPKYVPITKKLHTILKRYYDNLPDRDKTLDTHLFESVRAKANRRRGIDKTPKRESWADKDFSNIIKRTDLWEPKKDKKGNVVYKDGKMVKLWFHFQDFRHTSETRYKLKPYKLGPEEYGYLMGHLGRQTKTQSKYDHTDLELCHEIRENIDKGDAILARTLQKPGGDIQEPHEIAYNKSFIMGVQEVARELLKSERDGLRQRHGTEYVRQLEEFTELRLGGLPDTEKWLEKKTEADDFNQPREDYKREYGVYPEDDTVMQVWYSATRSRLPTTPVNKDRANAYLLCKLRSVYYKKEKEARYRFGIEARPRKGE